MKTFELSASEVAPLIEGAISTEVRDGALLIHRLDQRWAFHFPTGFVHLVEQQPSGVKIAFRTSARDVTLVVDTLRTMIVGQRIEQTSPYELSVNGMVVARARASAAGRIELEPRSGRTAEGSAKTSTIAFHELAEGDKEVALWLPYDEIARIRMLAADAEIRPLEQRNTARWSHYGSSISHGASAGLPTQSWPVLAAQAADARLTLIGLSGNAVLDAFAAHTIAEHPADIISIKVGINVVNNDCFTSRTFTPALHEFLDIVTRGHPGTPVLLVTPLFCPIIEHSPGPTLLDPDSSEPRFIATPADSSTATGRLSLSDIRRLMADAVAVRRQEQVQLISGLDLFGPADEELFPLADNIHPGPGAHRVIAQRFSAVLSAKLGEHV